MLGEMMAPTAVLRGAPWAIILLAVASLGPAAVAYEWHVEVVDSAGDVGRDTGLSLDEFGQPHISYYDKTNGDLKYAHLDGPGWHIEVVDGSGNVGEYTSLALDGDGHPHISYHGEDSLRCARKDASGWHIDVVVAGGEHTSLALDGGGYPRISYCADSSLFYAYEDAAGWHTDTVDVADTMWAYGSSLALDPSGDPHIGYETYPSGAGGWGCAKYAYKDGSGWHVETVDSMVAFASGLGAGTSLALDAAGGPHISGLHGLVALRHAYKQGASWQVELTGFGDMYVGGYTSLALDGSGYPCMLWHKHDQHSYVWQDGGGWHLEHLEPPSGCCPYDGGYPSLALDGADNPHASYYDAVNGDLKYARPTMVLTGSVEAGQLVLTWTPWRGTSQYWVYGAVNLAHFEPGFAPGYQHRLAVLSPLFQTWSSATGVGGPDHNWTYMVIAVDASEQELCRSNLFGEFDFSLSTAP